MGTKFSSRKIEGWLTGIEPVYLAPQASALTVGL